MVMCDKLISIANRRNKVFPIFFVGTTILGNYCRMSCICIPVGIWPMTWLWEEPAACSLQPKGRL